MTELVVTMFLSLTTLFCVGINDPGKNPGQFQNYVLDLLNPDCYFNWGILNTSNLENPKFNPLIWNASDGSINQAVDLTAKYRGRTWLVFNEPENTDQSNLTASEAAKRFDALYTALKASDPTATIACCGVIVSEKGVDWLKQFYTLVKNKPDVWHVHVYINSIKFSDWKAFIDYWWYWNKYALGNKETFITETCGTYQPDQTGLFAEIVKYSHPLLKRVYWFSAYPEPIVKDWKCNLLTQDGKRTVLGTLFFNRERIVATPTPNKATPLPEPPTLTPTVTPTKTPIPTSTPTPTSTATVTPMYLYRVYLSLIQN